MYQEIDNKVYEVIDLFKNNADIKLMLKLKDDIYNDQELKVLFDRIHELESNQYSAEYMEIKKQLLSNPKVIKYKELEKELYFIVLQINNNLKDLKKDNI